MNGLRALNERAALCRGDVGLLAVARVVALLLVVVGGIDVISTNVALAAGHIEGNPVISALQSQLGSWWSIPKIAFHMALALFVLWLPSRKMLSIARFVIVGYLLIAVNNFYIAGWPV